MTGTLSHAGGGVFRAPTASSPMLGTKNFINKKKRSREKLRKNKQKKWNDLERKASIDVKINPSNEQNKSIESKNALVWGCAESTNLFVRREESTKDEVRMYIY